MYGFKIMCEISKGTIEISHKILNPYTKKKYVIYCLLSLNCNVISLSEMSPWPAMCMSNLDTRYIPWNMHLALLCFALLWFNYQFLVYRCDIFTHIYHAALLALQQSYDCPSGSEVSLKDLGKIGQYQTKPNYKMCANTMVTRSSYLGHDGISYLGKRTTLYWIIAQALYYDKFILSDQRICFITHPSRVICPLENIRYWS